MLKYRPRLKVYTNSTGTNEVNIEDMLAHSYGHWCYLKRINGKIVFNEYSYSNSTRRHQTETLVLLRKLGIEIDVFVSMRSSLMWFESEALPAVYHEIYELQAKIERKGSHAATNAFRYDRIAELQQQARQYMELGATISPDMLASIKHSYLPKQQPRPMPVKQQPQLYLVRA